MKKYLNRCRFELLTIVCVIFVIGQVGAQTNVDVEVIEELNRDVVNLFDKKLKSIPDEVRREIKQCKTPTEISQISEKSQSWLYENFSDLGDAETAKGFEKLDEIRASGDAYIILTEAFWSWLNGEPLGLKKRIEVIGIYWLENERPSIEHAPEGKGKVEWIWKLDVKARLHGVLHVGLDLKTRRFLCYERDTGVYYPEGEILERIREEIVQNPSVAGIYLGKGRRK